MERSRISKSKSVSLWRHNNFLMFWSARTFSILGSQISTMAYPLIAILTLQITPLEMGLLTASSSAPSILVILFAGVIVDRIKRKPILIFADIGRFLLCISITLAYLFGVLRIEILYVVNFLSGLLMIVSDIAGTAFLKSLLEQEQLIEGNSKLASTDSAASMAGPGLSGLLVQILTPPITILVDAVSFIISAYFIWQIKFPEAATSPPKERKNILTEIGIGLKFVFGNSLLRALSQAIALHFLFAVIVSTTVMLYLTRELKLEAYLIGIVFSVMGIGFFLGSLITKLITVKFHLGYTIIGATLLNALAVFLISGAFGSVLSITIIFIIAHFLWACGMQIFVINLISLRQSETPDYLQGRMNASFKFLNVCSITAGGITAGLLGEYIGLQATLIIGACGMLLPFFRLLFSPVRNLNN